MEKTGNILRDTVFKRSTSVQDRILNASKKGIKRRYQNYD